MNNEIDLFDLFKILWKKKMLIIIPLLIVIVITTLYFYALPHKRFYYINVHTNDFKIILNVMNMKVKNHIDMDLYYELFLYYERDDLIEDKKIVGNVNLLPEERFVTSFIYSDEIESISKNSREHFLKNFLKIFEKSVFNVFINKIKNLEITYLNKIENLKKSIIIYDQKLETLQKANKNINKKKDFVSTNSIEFLSPEQQTYGFLVKKYQCLTNINNLKKKLEGIIKFLDFVSVDKLNSFSYFVKNKKFEEVLGNKPFLFEKFRENFIKQYLRQVKIISTKSNYIKYLIVFSFLTMIFMMFIVIFINLSKLNVEKK